MSAILNFVGLFYYDRLIEILLKVFLAAIFIWNFRLQNSEFIF